MERILNTGPRQSSLFADAPGPDAVSPMRNTDATLLERIHRANAARRADAPDLSLEHALHEDTGCADRLAVYGSLAPGESNHDRVESLGGRWQTGCVRGRRSVRTWPVFTWDEAAPPVAVHVLETAALRNHWPLLDAFEGTDYRRILVLVRLADAAPAVANLYSAAVPVDGGDADAALRNAPSTR